MPLGSYERLQGDDEGDIDEIHTEANLGPDLFEARPPTYYGEGSFDAPSSEDESLFEDKAGLPGSPGRAEYGDDVVGSRRRPSPSSKKRPASLRALVYSLIALVALAGVIGYIAATAYSQTKYLNLGNQKITMDHIFNGTFGIEGYGLEWVPEAGDGIFSLVQDGYIKLVDLKTSTTSNLVSINDIKDEYGRKLVWEQWKLSPDMKHLLLKSDFKKQWRWSSFGNYYIHDIENKETHPMIPPSNPPTTSYATWSPTGESIAYVTNNDLYVLPVPTALTDPIRVTTSGNASLFHGVPDWVYEEEIFSGDYTLWWSPDSSKIAFLAFDETLVDEYAFPVYNPTEDNNAVIPYTQNVVMKYPKPGYNNPLVSVHVFDVRRFLANSIGDKSGSSDFSAPEVTLTLDWEDRQEPKNSVILEVAWIDNSTLIVKEVNRNADDGRVVLFDLDAKDEDLRSFGSVVRKLGKHGEEGDNGWIDHTQTIYPLPSELTGSGHNGYLDVVPTPDGYDHIALFSPASSNTPRFLTSGKWEVSSKIKAIDRAKRLVYFEAAWPKSTERHIYSVPLPLISSSEAAGTTALTDVKKPSYFSSSFSPQAGFYLLTYQGPNTPWQKVFQIGNSSFEFVLTTNERLANSTRQFEAPTVVYSTIMSDGYELNVKEMRPPKMDDTGRTKYAVMFRVYGGPASQLVDRQFNRDWHDYLVCGLQYIVVIVDGRGTGFKGRKLRNTVKGNLGHWETIDQINAARIWATKNYVDTKRIGIWGWSYGGFMSSKVVEANAGIHSLAIAVAPVTSWLLYGKDGVKYGQNWLQTWFRFHLHGAVHELAVCESGWIRQWIDNDMTGFHHADYLLLHGSGDDNVHFANSAHLLDMFTKGSVRRFRFRMFTDSDHSIRRRGAQRELYEYMNSYVIEKWGRGGRRPRW